MLNRPPQIDRVQAAILILTPHSSESRQIAEWLRCAGLVSIYTARTTNEAIFLIGRQNVCLLICDESVPAAAEARFLWHIEACGHTPPPAIVRVLPQNTGDPMPPDRAKAIANILKPISSHEVVLTVGTALQRPDLIGVLDRNADQSAQHLATARRMQLGLLPSLADLADLQEKHHIGIAGFCRSGEAVGGDFWGVWPTQRGRIALALADFAGHGLSAALNTFRLHTILSEEKLPFGLPRRMTEILNQRLHALLPRGHYATMAYAVVDPIKRRVAWCSAGGPPPIFVSSRGLHELHGNGLPLGIKSDPHYFTRHVRFDEPGLLCLFSDGLYEGGPGYTDISRAEIAQKLLRAASLVEQGRLIEAAELGAAELETLNDEHPTDHTDDVMAVCLAIGPQIAQTPAISGSLKI